MEKLTWAALVLFTICLIAVAYMLGFSNGFDKGMVMTADECGVIVSKTIHEQDSICTARIARQFRTPPDTSIQWP